MRKIRTPSGGVDKRCMLRDTDVYKGFDTGGNTMYTLCATEKTAMQQRQFEEAFIELLREYPYDTITISQLCRYAGLSRKIFYRLFERKSDVLYGGKF